MFPFYTCAVRILSHFSSSSSPSPLAYLYRRLPPLQSRSQHRNQTTSAISSSSSSSLAKALFMELNTATKHSFLFSESKEKGAKARARNRPWKIAHIEIREKGGEKVESVGRWRERGGRARKSRSLASSPHHFLHFNYIVRRDMVFTPRRLLLPSDGSSRAGGRGEEEEKFLALSRGFLPPQFSFMALFSVPTRRHPEREEVEKRSYTHRAAAAAIWRHNHNHTQAHVVEISYRFLPHPVRSARR